MPELTILQFGPTCGIGFAMHAKPGVSDFAGLWANQLMPRKAEIQKPEKGVAFGICRCLPGVTDGSFEYLALLEATLDAPIPPGMVAVAIPRAHYAVFEVSSYAQLGEAWHKVPQALAAQKLWQPYCSPQDCDCAHYPSFEYYPWDHDHKGNAFLYIPVKRAL